MQECLSGCVSNGKSFFWCYNTIGGWDYCSPQHKDSPVLEAPSTDDVTIFNEKCETKCDTYGNSYFWCWYVGKSIQCNGSLKYHSTRTSSRQMLWDYCSKDNRHARYGQVTSNLVSCN